MSDKDYKKQMELNRRKFAREELADIEIRVHNKKTGKSRVERLEVEIIRQAMKGENDAIDVVSRFLRKKIEQDRRLFYVKARDSSGKLKLEKAAPVNNGAIGIPLAQFVTATMISACHRKRKLMPSSLHTLMLLVLGNDTFSSMSVKSYPRKQRARDFAVAFPSASLRLIADYAGKGTSPNSAKKWCIRKAEGLLDRIANDSERNRLIKSITEECRSLGVKIPEDGLSKKKGIYVLLQQEINRRVKRKAEKAEASVQSACAC